MAASKDTISSVVVPSSGKWRQPAGNASVGLDFDTGNSFHEINQFNETHS